VEAASPCGTVLKVTRAITPCGSQTETLTLQANSDEMKKQVQGLKKGSTVTVTCSPCPRSKRLIISGIKQAEGSEKSCPK
jgi:hypothetical protein